MFYTWPVMYRNRGGCNTPTVNVTFACRKAVTADASSNVQYSPAAKKEQDDFAFPSIVRENRITTVSYCKQIIRLFCRGKVKYPSIHARISREMRKVLARIFGKVLKRKAVAITRKYSKACGQFYRD